MTSVIRYLREVNLFSDEEFSYNNAEWMQIAFFFTNETVFIVKS